MNRNGFTLIEVIAVTALITILSVLALPSINRALADNNKNKCNYYEDAMVETAKLYIYREGEDIKESNGGSFPVSGVTIELKDLIDNLYIEEYSDSKTKVSDAKVLVTYDSSINAYKYKKYFKCLTTKNKVIYTDNGV